MAQRNSSRASSRIRAGSNTNSGKASTRAFRAIGSSAGVRVMFDNGRGISVDGSSNCELDYIAEVVVGASLAAATASTRDVRGTVTLSVEMS
jgi:hypothetical protein